jgi:tetratricopeptide (TPR) repeat protein
VSAQAQQFAVDGRLVVFVGAGVSSIPLTSLPSWWEIDRSVVVALRDRIAQLVGSDRARTLAEAITTRQEANRFPPEYQAEVIVRRLRDSYFTVLQCLDSDTPNDVHLGIAALAKARRVPAVVTTNFDRALEAAFRELDVEVEVWSNPSHFQTLVGQLQQTGRSDAPCPIIKLHGSAENPATLVDTLSQRKRGFAPEVAACVRHLLRYAHWLFLGYSGADLMADENYLFLKPDASEARGFTWLLRTNEQPVPALSATRAAYGNRAEIVHSELPDWLAQFSQPLLSSPAPRAPALRAATVEEIRRQGAKKVAGYATAWAASERLDRNVLVFADLLQAVGEPVSALDLVQHLYVTRPADERRSGHFGIVIDALANAYSQASRFDEAIALFKEALEIYDPATAEEQHVGALNNLALVYDKQGKTSDALRIYEQVLSFAENRVDAATRGVALHNIARARHRLGEDDQSERLYREELDIVRALGDEPARALVFNNLGELEVSRRRFDRAAEYLKEAMSIRDRIGDDLGAADTRANLGNVHALQGEHELALQFYEHSLDVFRRFGDRTDVARTLVNMARVQENTGKRDEAVTLLDRALAEASATGADPVRAQALQLVGEIRQKKGQNQESAETFQELIDLTVRIGDAKSERDARVGRGIALKALNEIEPAVAVLREALALTECHEFPAREWVVENLADALNLEGLARQQHGDLDGALEDFLESVDIWRRRRSLYNEGQTLINVGNTQVMRKQYEEAASIFQRAAAALLLANDRDGADSVALTAGELYVRLDRLDEASGIFRAIVNRATNYKERADRLNRIGELAGRQLERGATDQALRVFQDCCEWNREDGYLADAAACLMNIGGILKASGDAGGARRSFEKAAMLLKDHPHHALLARAKALLARTPSTNEPRVK